MDEINGRTRRKSTELFAEFVACLKRNEGESMIREKIGITAAQFGLFFAKAVARNRDVALSWKPCSDRIKFGMLPATIKALFPEKEEKIEGNAVVKVIKTSEYRISLELLQSEENVITSGSQV